MTDTLCSHLSEVSVLASWMFEDARRAARVWPNWHWHWHWHRSTRLDGKQLLDWAGDRPRLAGWLAGRWFIILTGC